MCIDQYLDHNCLLLLSSQRVNVNPQLFIFYCLAICSNCFISLQPLARKTFAKINTHGTLDQCKPAF